jgi:hypothetical protein
MIYIRYKRLERYIKTEGIARGGLMWWYRRDEEIFGP